MLLKSHHFFPLCILPLVLLSGCGPKPTYKLTPLASRTSFDQLTKKTETGEVTVRCSAVSRKNIRTIFGKQGDALLALRSKKRILPIQLHIQNDSDYTWALSPYDVKLPLADVDMVKRRFLKAATKKGIASYTIGSGLGIGLACLGGAASMFSPVVGASLIGAGCSMIFMAPIASHNKTAQLSEQNARYSYILDDITLSDDLIIHPHETVNSLVFVEHKNVQNQFSIRLCNHHNDEHTILYNLFVDTRVR